MSGGGICNVLESDTSYETRKENHDTPMDIWRLDFSVYDGSGRWLDHLIVRFQIDSAWPDCTNWDGSDAGRFSQPIEWASSIGHIQESGRKVVAPGQTLTFTKFFIIPRGDPEPRFEDWSMDFDFAAGPPPASGSTVSVSAVSAERETVFCHSIVNGTKPADFEAYLRSSRGASFGPCAESAGSLACPKRRFAGSGRGGPGPAAPAGAALRRRGTDGELGEVAALLAQAVESRGLLHVGG